VGNDDVERGAAWLPARHCQLVQSACAAAAANESDLAELANGGRFHHVLFSCVHARTHHYHHFFNTGNTVDKTQP